MPGWKQVVIPDEACVKPSRWIVEQSWNCKAETSGKTIAIIVNTYSTRKKTEILTREGCQCHHLTHVSV